MDITVEEVIEQFSKARSERLREQVEEGFVNPIELAKFLGVAPQSVYNAIKSGKISTSAKSVTQKITIPLEVAAMYAAQYIDKRIQKQKRIDAELKGAL